MLSFEVFETMLIMTFLGWAHGLGLHNPCNPWGMWATTVKSKKLNTTVTHDGKMFVFILHCDKTQGVFLL